MIDFDTPALLEVSRQLAALRQENRALRHENARLRAERTNFDISADSTPCLLRKQAG